MQDDDNDDHEDDNEDDNEDEPSIRSYSKKKHFGKLGRDLKLCNAKISYKPNMKFLNTLKFTGEGGKNNINDPITSNLKCKVDHKYKYEDFSSKSKVSLNLKNHNIQNVQLNNKLSKNLWGGTLIFSNQINKRRQWSTKISHSAKLIQNLKLKYGLQCDSKNEKIYGVNLRCEMKRNLQKPSFISFIDQYNELFSIFGSIKSNTKTKIETTYKSHLITKQNNRMYLEHKGTYDSSVRNNSPFSHSLTFNAQDSEGIGTINSSINFQNLLTIKSKEVRLLIQYNKMIRFGVQKRNNIYEFMIERYRMNKPILKSMKLYVGNKGILSIFDGRFGLGRNKIDYTLSLRLKPDGNNFYEDFSTGLGLKWNI